MESWPNKSSREHAAGGLSESRELTAGNAEGRDKLKVLVDSGQAKANAVEGAISPDWSWGSWSESAWFSTFWRSKPAGLNFMYVGLASLELGRLFAVVQE